MKNFKYITAGLFMFSALVSSVQAQVAIGKDSVTNDSVSLEFGSGNRGLILPWVDSEAAVVGAVDGTLIFDIDDKTLKVRQNGAWLPFTNPSAGAVNTALQDGLPEDITAKVSVGSTVSAVPGILVLEDNDKAMILPKVESPHLNINNPEAGTIVFDTKKQQVAVFNGVNWEFWN